MSNIVVPQLGESVVEARVARWLKKEGDRVETGEPVVELETEKIDLEVGAEHARRDQPASSEKKARTSRSANCWPWLTRAAPAARQARAAQAAQCASTEPRCESRWQAARRPQPSHAEPPPRRRRPARDANSAAHREGSRCRILAAVQGSGSAGRVTKQDVRSAIDEAARRPQVAPAREARPRRPRQPEPGERQAIAPKNVSECPSDGRRLRVASSRRSAPPRC